MKISIILSWLSLHSFLAVSQTITFTYETRGNQFTKTNDGHLPDTVRLGMKVILQGGYLSSTSLIRDSYRQQGYFSITKPDITTYIFEPFLTKRS
jgi:hypothetical protein